MNPLEASVNDPANRVTREARQVRGGTALPRVRNQAIQWVLLLACLSVRWGFAAESADSLISPVNQVFQFMHTGECAAWTNGVKTTATAYLWIPERCRQLRGLVILCANVPEHRLVGHPAIRAACAAHDLGIFWGTPSFYNFNAKTENRTAVAFLQQLLAGLARTSGYDEVATVPWLPMGESGHLLMVDALLEEAPERCLAGVYLKNNAWPPRNRQTPVLVAFGTAQEWSQDKSDLRTNWNHIAAAYAGVLRQRRDHPQWPLSYIIDGGSGHFDCSERLTSYIARYIGLVAVARRPDAGGSGLKPVALEQGFLTDLPVPGHEHHAVTAWPATAAEARGVPWYFDAGGAEEAQAIARINWQAETQLPAFADDQGQVFPYTFNGIAWLPINKPPASPNGLPTPTLETGPDGVSFTLQGVLLDKLPSNFVGAGEKLGQAPGLPSFEWLCGCVEPLGNGRFRMALDRTWPSPIYIAVRHPGNDRIRAAVQPGQISRDNHAAGKAQKITFPSLPDVKAGTRSLPLLASSDAALPVSYFVVVGPAVVKDDTLVFTPLPPRTQFPVTVTVAAWQWGRGTEPKVRTAEIVKRTFQILAP